MSDYGVRRLVILSGDPAWCYEQALTFTRQYPGDWPWISDRVIDDYPYLQRRPSAVNNLLGSEFRHAVFDATQGLHAEALAAVSGTLAAGSILVMMVPEWHRWPQREDADSLRWSECSQPISTPNFIHHFQQQIMADSDVILLRQHHPVTLNLLSARCDWLPPDGSPTAEQQNLLATLFSAEHGTYVLIAGRGRGKSALAGMMASDWPGTGKCWLTAPAQASTDTLQSWSNGKVTFFSPDGLLEQCRMTKPQGVDWLIIDEAAAIPASVLYQLSAFFPRILLTTTVQGYEGSGRGFLLKFCAGLPEHQILSLNRPVRWADNDPLERVMNHALLMDAEDSLEQTAERLQTVMHIDRPQLAKQPALLTQFYGLLTSAHYRTSPLDLRRLFDAPGMSFSVGLSQDNGVIAALWSVDEGGLSADLAREVWAGRRRPRGNLVAQSLAAHGSEYLAPQLSSSRISRIAVISSLRRQGIAKSLVSDQIRQAKDRGLDYLSVSFGYTDELWSFWQACGFELIHMGSHKEASSGCYSAMALVPFTQRAIMLTKRSKRHFLLGQLLNGFRPECINDIAPVALDDDDWLSLAGFAFALRTPDATQVSLYRLLRHPDVECRWVRMMLEQRYRLDELVQLSGVSGKKELIKLWRYEVAQALTLLDKQKSRYWKDWVLGIIPLECGS
ncbi:tRNA(Met) cytidine acetyltransferase TmcA [Budvicia aquatica]|uniref:tRNA(Met) cytidine acetyltransferase TmcA n=2 Tax=Budvicia aquatica TaxID=82979 RepID=A0A2C6DTS0_9GAMM|nr:tRNA(Met) cytidine acetyltransferase [Budvicia aquatica]VFS52880.1 tRNA(Met) cytidine acetyltransferase TmcA [Budvicia aquatica]